MFSHKQLLLAEIEFWQEMIDCQDRLDATPAMDRMSQALALAERKLSLIDTAGPEEEPGHIEPTPPSPAIWRTH